MSPSPNAQQFRQARELFEAALSPGEVDRDAYLVSSVAPDEVFDEVRALLAAVTPRTSHLTRAMRGVGSLLALADSPEEIEPNTRLGPWERLTLLGEGGMGRVSLARRADGHFEQLAAVKVVGGIASLQGHERLAQERQLLAMT